MHAAPPDAAALRPVVSDFSPIAHRYDATRDVPAALLDAAYDRLRAAGLLAEGAAVLDAGCGTGQMSIPLAAAGHPVSGYDISAAMAAIARGKCRPGWRARYATADVRALPEAGGAFDAVVVSKLFMHVADWRAACRETLRVLRPGGTFVHLAERGAFANPVRRYFAAAADALGFVERFPGLRDRRVLVRFLEEAGCTTVAVDLADLRWEKPVVYGDVLRQFEERLFAEFWYLPDDIYACLLRRTAAWVDGLPEGRATTATLTPWLEADVLVRA
ncbi:MAG: class I SAM-dependent methyltransferase [Alphaproteobacteria bacterium]